MQAIEGSVDALLTGSFDPSCIRRLTVPIDSCWATRKERDGRKTAEKRKRYKRQERIYILLPQVYNDNTKNISLFIFFFFFVCVLSNIFGILRSTDLWFALFGKKYICFLFLFFLAISMSFCSWIVPLFLLYVLSINSKKFLCPAFTIEPKINLDPLQKQSKKKYRERKKNWNYLSYSTKPFFFSFLDDVQNNLPTLSSFPAASNRFFDVFHEDTNAQTDNFIALTRNIEQRTSAEEKMNKGKKMRT